MSAFHGRHSDAAELPAPDDRVQVDALRFWLASGLHRFAVDPRRRLGAHRRAKELLTQDRQPSPASSGGWPALAATLDRHTVVGGMTELSPEERRVVMLAYLEGRTNSEIAAALDVSVGTVRRRLRAALKQIDTYLTRTGTWVFAILVLGAGYVVGAAARLGRSANAIGSADWAYKLVSATAVSAVTAAAIGVAAVSPDSTSPRNPSTPATAQVIASPPSASAPVSPGQRSESDPQTGTIVVMSDRSHGLGPSVNAILHRATKVLHANHGCGSKSINAPPRVPVRSHRSHPKGPAVSHPTAGGCHT